MTTVERALVLWGLEGATVTLIAARENAVYRVDHTLGRFALRLHRRGYRTHAQLAAELDWMAVLDRAGLSVPAPIPSLGGAHLQVVDGVQTDVLTWLEGETLDVVLPRLDADTRRTLFHRLGQTMAHLHAATDCWPGAATCERPAWDVAGLLGEAPLWDRFWDNPALRADQKAMLTDFRAKATEDLNALASSLDYGLIHADLVAFNVMWSGDTMHLIDFDDGGFGFRLFELATALLKHRDAPDYPALQEALLEGYAVVRSINTGPLPLFLALRAVTYVGWNMSRRGEDATDARNARFIAQAQDVATAYLGRQLLT